LTGAAIANKHAWLVVALLWAVALLNYLDRQVIFSLFPLLRVDLRLSDVQLGLLGTAFLWVYAAFSPLAGWMADRFGRRRVILASLAIWSLVTAATALARGFPALVAIRGLMGISEAFYIPAGLALISSWHGERTRSRAVGIHQSGIYAGIVLGGFGGAWIGEHYGWRTVFWLLGAIGLVYAAILPLLLREARSNASAAHTSANFAASARSVIGRKGFWPVLAVFTAMSMASWLVYTWMPLFLYEKFNLSLTAAGFTATFYVQVASVAGILLGGWLADWFAARHPRGRVWTQVGGLCLAAPFLTLSGVTAQAWVLYAALILYGIGRGIYDCNIMPVLCDVVSPEERSTGYGLLNFAGTIAGGLIAYAAGALKATLGIGAVLAAVGIAVSLCSVLLLRVPQERSNQAPYL
jgi:MFS family permease